MVRCKACAGCVSIAACSARTIGPRRAGLLNERASCFRAGPCGLARRACGTSHVSHRIPLIPPNPTYPTESHLSHRIPLIPPNPAYPTESHLSHRIPLVPPNPAYPTESRLSRRIPPVPPNPTHPTESHSSHRIPLIPPNPACPTASRLSHRIPPVPPNPACPTESRPIPLIPLNPGESRRVPNPFAAHAGPFFRARDLAGSRDIDRPVPAGHNEAGPASGPRRRGRRAP